MRNLIRALRGKPVELSPKQEEKMAAAKAKAAAIIAEREAAGRKAMEEAAQFMATQGGGASIGGPYQDEVLHARLDQRSGLRPPLDTEYRPPPSFVSEVFDMFNPLDPVHALPRIFNRNERPQLGPYCGTVDG